MATDIEVFNQSLGMLGEDLITVIDSSSTAGRLGQIMIPLSRRSVIRDITPNFSVRYVTLTESTDPFEYPDFEFKFKKPAGCIRVLAVKTPEILSSSRLGNLDQMRLENIRDWSTAGEYIGAPEKTITVKYAKDVGIGNWDSLSIEALSAHIAMKVAFPLTGSKAKIREIRDLYSMFVSDASSTSNLEGIHEKFRTAKRLPGARHAGSGFGRR